METFQSPDIKAPRFRLTSKSYLNRETFDAFFKKHPEYSSYNMEDVKKIINTFNEMIYKGIIEERDGIELPENLGNVFIGSCKAPKKQNTDFYKSKVYGTRVINRNLASDGYLAKIFYTNYQNRYKFRNAGLWKLKGCRDFTRLVSSTYKEDWPKYIVIEEYVKISSMLKKHKIKSYAKMKSQEPIPDNYNEFDLD
jgi:hypothetical protein